MQRRVRALERAIQPFFHILDRRLTELFKARILLKMSMEDGNRAEIATMRARVRALERKAREEFGLAHLTEADYTEIREALEEDVLAHYDTVAGSVRALEAELLDDLERKHDKGAGGPELPTPR